MTFFDTGNPPGVHKDCWCGSEAEIKAWPGNQADVLQSQNLPPRAILWLFLILIETF